MPDGPADVASETDLVEALRGGDDRAYEDLVRRHSGRLLAVARRYLTEDDARDAVQETFGRAFQSIDRFDGRSRLATWLHRILVNVCLMRIRRAERKPEEPIETLLPAFHPKGYRRDAGPPWTADASEIAHTIETRQLLTRAMATLPEAYRQVLLLRELEGLEVAEIAARLELTPNAVRIRLHRAKQAVREQLDDVFKGSKR